jgi:zinc transport system ATP-binding protein
MQKLIALQNIYFSFDNKETYILKDISFSVSPWEIISIIWLNGSGKSTLLKIIAWVYSSNSWKIIRNYKVLSYIPQKLDIDKTFPIETKEFLKIYNPKTNDDEIKSYLKKFKSEYLFDKNIWNLSGWEFQRVLIVSALISKPDLILLDEPTAWIDILWEEKFYEVIAEIKNSFPKISIILVSHNLNLVYKNSDKVICLHENNFCCHGTPNEVKNNKLIKELFWDYLLPYEHKPHKHHKDLLTWQIRK